VAERLEVAQARDPESLDRHAVDLLGSSGERVVPREVVTRAGREDAHAHAWDEQLREIPCVQLGAAADIGAVPLNDDGDLQRGYSGGS
jgi:hypothetical protein